MPATIERREYVQVHPVQAIHPFHAVMLAATVPLFLGALLSDWAYWRTYHIQWANFSSWLLAGALVFGYGIGLDLTRRDLQAAAKARGLPWDTAKGFDQSAPVSELLPASQVGELSPRTLSLHVNGELRQQSTLDMMIWDVPEILHELSKLYALRAGDLVFMGTPAGVAALRPGDECVARLDDLLELRCRILPPTG